MTSPYTAWRARADSADSDSPPTTILPPPTTSQMDLDPDIAVPVQNPTLDPLCAFRLVNSRQEFDALYQIWFGRFRRDPVTAGPPPVPYAGPPTPPPVRALPSPRTRTTDEGEPDIGKSLAAKPDRFDGSKEKFLQWWRTIELFIAGHRKAPTDRQKVILVLSYMTGDNAAGRFADLYNRERRIGTESFDNFAAKLRFAFRPAAIQRKAEKELLGLRQGKEAVEDFVVRMKHLIIEAEYDLVDHSRLLINILRTGVHNDVVEYVERSQPALLDSHSFTDWELALVHADQVLSEIADRKRGASMTTTTRSFPSRPSPTTGSTAFVPQPQSAPKPSVHPNQPGTFGGHGIPMDIGKARAEGKCAKCGGPWPCKEHMRPRRQIRFIEFKGAKIFYQNSDELADAMKVVEQSQDFVKGA